MIESTIKCNIYIYIYMCVIVYLLLFVFVDCHMRICVIIRLRQRIITTILIHRKIERLASQAPARQPVSLQASLQAGPKLQLAWEEGFGGGHFHVFNLSIFDIFISKVMEMLRTSFKNLYF